VAFLRFSRDKRGYEHFYLVEPSGRGRARVLFWFRTPPNIKVGRTPFDPEVRRALEARYPNVVFDWAAIVETPIPPPVEPERWRERRRLERAMRAAQHEDGPESVDPAARTVELRPPGAASAGRPAIPDEPAPTGDSAVASNFTASGGATAPANGGEAAASAAGDSRPRRRRRRRRSKKNVQAAAPVVEPSAIQDSEDAADQGPDGE
jgi:hypothetical protein